MDTCVFCNIAKKMSPANIVAEDPMGGCIAFMDIRPINRGHVLVMPYTHAPRLADLTAHEELYLTKMAIRIANALQTALPGCTAVNVIINDGKDAGQEIPHTHIHVVPRYANDGFRFKNHQGNHKPDAKELEDDASLISRVLTTLTAFKAGV